MAVGAKAALAQTGPMAPPSTVTTPPRDFGPDGAPTTYFRDPDVLTVDPALRRASRSRTAPSSACGPARSGPKGRPGTRQGRYLVWSDIPNNRQLRWLEDDGRVSVFRTPSNNSNGNTFDFQGRQLSCEHLTRRVVRYEHDGSVTVHRRLPSTASGSTRRTTSCRIPTAATGSPTRPMVASSTRARPTLPAARATRRAGSTRASASRRAWAPSGASCRPTATASIRAAGSTSWSPRSRCPTPNGLCFSPDHKRLYVASTGKGPGDTGPGRQGRHLRLRRRRDNKLSNGRVFTDCMVDGVKCGPDGVRCDVNGNVWALEQCRPRRRLQRRHRLEPGRQADRPHPPARDLRQRLLRRAQAQPPVHGGEPVALRRLHQHPGRGAGLSLHTTRTPASWLTRMEAPDCGRLLFSTDGLVCTRSTGSPLGFHLRLLSLC